MNKLNSKARDRCANLIIIVLALFLAATLAKEYFYVSQPEGTSLVGSRLPLEGVDWESAEQTLLLLLDDTCPYTGQSMPFYKQLAEHAAGRHDLRLLGVVDGSVKVGKRYVEENDVHIDVIKWYFRQSRVFPTPTLLLVNRAGEVTKQWTGRLSPAGEAEVIGRLFGESGVAWQGAKPDSAPQSSADVQGGAYGISIPDLLGLMKEQRVTLLDLDERENYAAEHIAQAKNIPMDELYIRALDELDQDAHIILYARNYGPLFLSNVQVLKRQGFNQVRILRGGLEGWKSAGLPVAAGRAQSKP